MNIIRLLEEDDYYRFKKIFEDNSDLLDGELFVFEYNGKARLVVKKEDYADVYKMISPTEYKYARLFNGETKLDQIDYCEYSLNLRRVPRFINHKTNCVDFLYTVNGTNWVQYSQCSIETGARAVLEYDGDVKKGVVDLNIGGKEPSQIYFQNKVEKDYEEQKYMAGGIGFSKLPDKDKYVRIFGMNGKKPTTIPFLSKTYDYEVIKQMLDKGNYNETIPQNLLDLYTGDELSLYFELSFALQNVDKLTPGRAMQYRV